MSQANVVSLLKTILVFLGTFLIGHSVANQPITSDLWDMIIGVVVSLTTTIWAVATKTSSYDMIESTIRSVLTGVGGFLVSANIIPSTTLAAIIGLVAPILAFIQSVTSKAKVISIANKETVPATNKSGQLNGTLKKVA